MKKIMTVLIAAAIVLCGAVLLKGSFTVSAKISPTAPTITDPSEHTVTVPPDQTTNTNPYTGTSPAGTTSPGTPGTTGTPGVTRGTTPTAGPGAPASSGAPTAPPTAPGGSTITAPVQQDQNPESPKTGETSGAVFAFAGVAMTGAAAAILFKKHKETV